MIARSVLRKLLLAECEKQLEVKKITRVEPGMLEAAERSTSEAVTTAIANLVSAALEQNRRSSKTLSRPVTVPASTRRPATK